MLMSIRLHSCAALLTSAAFLFSSVSFAQAPIYDASSEVGRPSVVNNSAKPSASANSAVNSAPVALSEPAPLSAPAEQGEMFYQLQLLQQEVMQLRGLVEEQAYSLQQLKEQNRERYIDLDRRLGEMTVSPASTSASKANTAVGVKPAVAVNPVAGEKKAYDNAYSLVTSRRFDEALDAFKQFLVDYPGGAYAPNSYYWMGELYQVINPSDLEAARQSFTQLLEQYPEHPKSPDAMYKLGKVYYLTGNKTKSKQLLEKVVVDYSQGSSSSAADKARQFINTNF